MTTLEEGIAAVKAAFPTAEVVEVRDVGIPWCDAFDKHLAAVREEGERFVFYYQLRWIAMELGRKPGWAAVVFKDEYGLWPPWEWSKRLLPFEPTEEMVKKVRRRDAKAAREWKKLKEVERDERTAQDVAPEGGAQEVPAQDYAAQQDC